MTLSTTFNQLEVSVFRRQIIFNSNSYVQALNGDTADGTLTCSLNSGQPLVTGVSYNVLTDFHNCSTSNGGFSLSSFSTTIGRTQLYYIYGNNGPCNVLYGPLTSSDVSGVLQPDALSVGGAVYVRLGEPGCILGTECLIPSFVDGICDSAVEENAEVSLGFFDVSVVDPDGISNTMLSYDITDGNELGHFSLDPLSGGLTLVRSVDRDTGLSSFTLLVSVSDGVFNASLTVLVEILDENDNSPVPIMPAFSARVDEGVPINTYILTALFTDQDDGDNARLTYAIIPASLDFAILDPSTANITTSRVFDFEDGDQAFSFVVTAVDSGTPPRMGMANVFITVVDVNDNRPSLEVTLRDSYVEDRDSVNPASVVLLDADSNAYPLLYAVATILNPLDQMFEVLDLSPSLLPVGFKIGYYNYSLFIVGSGTPELYTSLLNNVTYENTVPLFQLPLFRTITFGVCDMLRDPSVLSLFSPDTQLAFQSMANSPQLPETDAVQLLGACLEPVRDQVAMPLVETNDRPVVVDSSVILPSVLEDLPNESNRGFFIIDEFGDAITDIDRDSILGIAITGHGNSAVGERADINDNSECILLFNNISSMGPSGCQGRALDSEDLCACPPNGFITCVTSSSDVIFTCVDGRNSVFCSCPLPEESTASALPEFSDITLLELDHMNSSRLDLSPLLVRGASRLDYTFASTDELYNFLFSISSLSGTDVNGTSIDVRLSAFSIVYEALGDEREDSALVLGPYDLFRWVPVENMNGVAYLNFKGWDTTNGIPYGTRNVDTTLVGDTSFSLEEGNATANIVPVNDPPTILLSGGGNVNFSTVYEEGGPSVFVADRNAMIIEIDQDNLLLFDLTVIITGVGGSCNLPDYEGMSNDTLSYLDSSIVPLDDVDIERLGQACITYTFRGSMSVDNWRSFLTMIRFSVSNEEPSEHTRQLTFVISDGSSTSTPAYTTIEVVLVSDLCPEVILESIGPVEYLEHSSPVLLDPMLTVSDGDRNPMISSATVQIIATPNDRCMSCVLGVNSTLPSGITSNFDTSTLTLSFGGSASPEMYTNVLRTVNFADNGDEPSFNLVMVRFSVRDPSITSCQGAMADIGVMIEHLNDNSPIIHLNYPTSQDYITTFTEGSNGIGITGMVNIIDPDGLESETYIVQVTIETGCVTSEDILSLRSNTGSVEISGYNETTCSLTVEGNSTVLEADLSSIIYMNTNVDNPSGTNRSISFTVIDGLLDPGRSVTTLFVIPVNDGPRLDLDVENLVSSDSMRILTEQSITITGPMGGSIADLDDVELVRMTLLLNEVDSGGNVVPRSDEAFEALELTPPLTLDQFGLSGTFIFQSGEWIITGASLTANYITVLNNIVYSNRRMTPSDDNNRRVVVSVSDGELSAEATSIISLDVMRNPPVLDLNGEEAGTNVQTTYTLTNPPLLLFPTASLRDIDGNNICTLNISMVGSDSTCPPTSIDFTNAYSDISVDTSDASNGANYLVTSRFTDCREPIVIEDVLRGVTFSNTDNTAIGVCTLYVSATDDTGLVSSTNVTAVVDVVAFNLPPFIDLDLGLAGRDYSTIYFQGGRTQHIVSIFDAATARNITDMTVVGEAMDMAGEASPMAGDTSLFDDGTIFNGVVILEESNAGYVLRDVDSPTLTYLQAEFFSGTNLENDVISFPCEAAVPVPAYGCMSSSAAPLTFLAPTCNNSVFDACTLPNSQDICNDLQVTIFCSTPGRKAYRFAYLSNPLTTRYETLLGLLGYDFLPTIGGQINQVRLINVTVLDELSGTVNPLAITRVRIRNQDVLIIELDPPSFIVYEDERPLRTCNLYTIRVRRLDGSVPSPADVVYNITQGNIGNAFGLTEEGVIFLNNAVDRETLSRYDLTIIARIRTADPDTTASGQLVANVVDVNDNHPITADSYSVNVSEGMAGVRVVQVVATDADEGDNADLTYLLLGIGAERFQVDSNGLVTTRVALNRSIDDYYLLVMIIMDRGEIFLSTHTVINVMVITPPPTQLAFVPFPPLNVLENTIVGTALSPPLLAEEVGGTGDTTFIRYRFIEIISDISGPNQPNVFVVDEISGIISINSNLDSEATSSYSAVAEAFSVRSLFPPMSALLNITFNILDVNELPPSFEGEPYSFNVVENTPTSSTITRFVATDSDDMNRGLIYSLASGTPSTLPFQVEDNGDLVVVGDLDYESTRDYTFNIVVNDIPTAGMTSMQDSAVVMVTILDRNDNPPVFRGTPYNVSVLETAPTGFIVLNFTSDDADAAVNSMVEYSAQGLEQTPFCLSTTSMSIEVCNAMLLTSFEVDRMLFSLSLVATNPASSAGDVSQVTTEPVSIYLELVNEFDPIVTEDVVNHTGYHEEFCGRHPLTCDGLSVFNSSTISSDNDGGAGGDLIYLLLTTNVPFSLNEVTGELVVDGEIDREVEDFYSLTVMVSDNGDSAGRVRQALVTINIPIYDIDDNPPVIMAPFVFSVTESRTMNTFTTFGVLTVEDPDINGTREFQVLSFSDPPLGPGCIIDVPSTSENYLPVQVSLRTGELSFCQPIDFETNRVRYEFTINLRDFGNLTPDETAEHIVQANIIVNVLDSNDNTPSFNAGQNLNFAIFENSAIGMTVGSVSASDRDSDENAMLGFTVVDGSSPTDCSTQIPFYADLFNDTSAAIVQCQGLDYEGERLYTITVAVADGGDIPLSSTAVVTVAVLDRNDNPPVFDSDSYTMDVFETDSSLVMSSVVIVSVSDLDSEPNSISTFSIVSPLPSPFGIRFQNSTSAEVFVESPEMINFEAGITSYEVVVEATNRPAASDDETQFANTTITVVILDVNDNTPIIMPPFVFSVRENQDVGATVDRVIALDSDTGIRGQLNYYIGSPGTDQSCTLGGVPFTINTTSGVITTCQPLDYETTMTYRIEVVVCDSTTPPMCSNMSFVINVLDLNDNSPVYNEDPFIVNLNEHSPNRTVVDTITSTDADSAPNAIVIYSLLDQTLPFVITANEVLFNGPSTELDFEGPIRTYMINVRGTNPPFFSDDVTRIVDVALVINIIDRNDQPPIFPARMDFVEISEHSSVGTVVYMLSTTDADSLANSAVTYSIIQTDTPFAIEGNNVVVRDSNVIDFDPPLNVRNYMLTIQANNLPSALDDVTQVTNFTLSIGVGDINDNSPVCVGRNSFMIREDAATNSRLGEILAEDIDSGLNGNQGIMYFTSNTSMGDQLCSEEDPFSIDPDSGTFSICIPFDYERRTIYNVNFTVCDGGRPLPLCTTCPVVVSIIDVNDNAPIINPPTFFSVSELAALNSEVGCVSAEDADSGQNALLEYHFSITTDDCSFNTPFSINESSGCISVCSSLDYEITMDYTIEVVVSDRGSPRMLTMVLLSINVTNENDEVPVITSSPVASAQEEEIGALVIRITSSDADFAPFDENFYAIRDGDDAASFSIDTPTGVIVTSRALDREVQETYTIIVEVSDGANTNNQTLTITLVDINDNPPEYQGRTTFMFDEESFFQTVLVFRDNDTGINGNLTYTVSDVRFNVNDNGLLTNLQVLDRDPTTGGDPEIEIVVTARDQSDIPFESSVALSIALMDINDNSPQLATPITGDIIDGSRIDTEVATARGEDADEGINAQLRYFLGNPSDTFAIDSITGVISLVQDIFITTDTAQRLEVLINVSDSGLVVRTDSVLAVFFVVSSRPQFSQDVYTFSISENSLAEPFGMVFAMDRDINEFNDVFEYSILSVSPYDAGFALIGSSLNITLFSPESYLDFEDARLFNITVAVGRINMTGVIDDTTTVLLMVEEVNDNVPLLSPLNISAMLPENADVGTFIIRAVAIDFDAGALTYNLSGDGANLFSFTENGDLILSEASIDFEVTPSYELTYQACDNGIPQLCSRSGLINIEVVDVDDLPPVFFPTSYTADIPERFGLDRLIILVNVTDEDTPFQDLQLSLRPLQSSFQIVSLSGVGALMTTAVPLDRETQDFYQFSVVAVDPSLSESSADITIRVLDENDERPSVQPSSGLVVEFNEGGPPVFPGTDLTIVDRDTTSMFPLLSTEVMLQPNPSSVQGYPNPGGVCDHANYSLLFDNNSHRLCGQEGCLYLLREEELDFSRGAVLQGNILEIGMDSISRNSLQIFNGQLFETFTITLWVRFPSPTSGNILDVQGTGINVFELTVDEDGSLGILIRPSATDSEILFSSGSLPTHDGEWHQIAFIRSETTLSLYFDCEEVASTSDNGEIPTNFIGGSFFMGVRLGSFFISEFYFCSSVVLPRAQICCTLSCGEFLSILPESTPDGVNVTVNPRTRSLQIVYTNTTYPEESIATLEEALGAITYHNQLDEPHPMERGLTLLVSDEVGVSDQPSVVILRPVLLNDRRPVLDLNGVTEEGINFSTIDDEIATNSTVIGVDSILYDGDSGYWPIASVRLQLNESRRHIFVIPPLSIPGLDIALTSEGRMLTIASNDPLLPIYPEQYNDVIQQVRYVNLQEVQIVFEATIEFVVQDSVGTLNDPISFTSIRVIPTNDPPILDLNTQDPSTLDANVNFLENTGFVNILSGTDQSISDVDNTRLSQATISFTLRPDGESETLRLDPAVNIATGSSVFDSTTETLTISLLADFSVWLDVLRSVQYVNTGQNPSDLSPRQVVILVQDEGRVFSEPAYVNIAVVNANDPPELYLGGPNTIDHNLNFTEDGPCVSLVAPDFRLFEPDSAAITIIRVTISGGVNRNVSAESIEYDGERPPAVIPFGGGAFITNLPTTTDYENIIRNLLYCNIQDEPNEVGGRQVEFRVSDNGLTTRSGIELGGQSSISTSFINILRVNDRPAVFFMQLDDVSIRNTPTAIINSSTIRIDDSDDTLFGELNIFITNSQDGSDNEIIEFFQRLPEASVSRGPFNRDGRILYTVTFTGGADAARVIETISELRYNNRAENLTVLPPREVCVELSDFKIFSMLTCVNVTISQPNNFMPVFNPSTITSYSFFETSDSVTIATLEATDDDSGREGAIVYTIDQVRSRNGASIAFTTDIFSIGLSSGELSAPNGLDAEQHEEHAITVLASDQGNPVRSASIVITVSVSDINDLPPTFMGALPYIARSEGEDLIPPVRIFTVFARDFDATSENSQISGYGLENFQDQFRIDTQSGAIESFVALDAEVLQDYVLNVSATDSGTPPLVSYTTVSFSLIDRNDNPAIVEQLTPAVYVLNLGSSSIGPAIRIVDADLSASAINTVTVTLTPDSADFILTYDRCLVVCQDTRLMEANLLAQATDLLNLATFTVDGSTQTTGGFSRTTVGTANCPAVTLTRGPSITDDGYGEINRNLLPASFATGDYSVSFVLTQNNEGLVLVVPDQADRTLPPEDVEREFAFWIRRRAFTFYYVYGSSRTRERATISVSNTPLNEYFDPINPQTRHFTVVISSNPPQMMLYVDCEPVSSPVNLVGEAIAPNSNINLFIGQSRPHPLVSGRLGGQIHGLYYHPVALSSAQITEFCSCGSEALIPPSLPLTIETIADATDDFTISLRGTSGLIPNDDIISVLRTINYTNPFTDPSSRIRLLTFTITEENNQIGRRQGRIQLVMADNDLPVVDLNGITNPGLANAVSFQEGGTPVLLSPTAVISRDIEGFINPTFSRVRVQISNPMDVGEVLDATATDVISVTSSEDGQLLDIEGPGIPREFQDVLQTLTYANLNSNPTTSEPRRITYLAFDTEGRTNLEEAISVVTLISLNNAPQVSLSMEVSNLTLSIVQFEERSEGVVIASNISITDVDNTDLMSAVLTLTSPNLPTDRLETAVTGTNISPSYDTNTGELTLSGADSISNYQQVISRIMFVSTDSPFLDTSLESLTRVVTVVVSDGELSSDAVTIQVLFMPDNDPPTITILNPNVTFRDGDITVPIAPSADITDSDNRRLLSMRVELEGTFDTDTLSSGNQTGRILLFSENTIAEFVSILRSISYINTDPEPILIPRTISIEVCDFFLCSNAAILIEIVDRNDNIPTFSSDTYLYSISENMPPGSTVGTLSATDSDVEVTVFAFSSNEPLFELVPDGSQVHILTTTSLNFEEASLYRFNVTVSDGVNTGQALVEVIVDNVNEPPQLTFTPAEPALVIGPASQNRLIEVQFQISDPDLNDLIPTVLLTLRNVPEGSNESLIWISIPGYTFQETSVGSLVYQLSGPGDFSSLQSALSGVHYLTGERVLESTAIRTVAIVLTDDGGSNSEEAIVTVSLSSIPQFTSEEYSLSLMEETIITDFLQVEAAVESGGDVITYAVDGGRGVVINSSSGFLSLVEAVDRETMSSLVFSVFAVDALPPARTGTAVVNITILDLNDVRPSISGLNDSITIFTNQPSTPFDAIQVVDPDTMGGILLTTVTVFGNVDLAPSPFTGRVCVDERNVVDKIGAVCGGLENGLTLLDHVTTTQESDFSLVTDGDDNDILTFTTPSYARIETDFSSFTGRMDAFTFVSWVQADGSGYLVYFGTRDSIERYFALYYNEERNQLIVTLKREGVDGLSGQIRINFQLISPLSDSNYHLVMLEYSQNSLSCYVDGELLDSVAVVYKEEPFIGQVFGK